MGEHELPFDFHNVANSLVDLKDGTVGFNSDPDKLHVDIQMDNHFKFQRILVNGDETADAGISLIEAIFDFAMAECAGFMAATVFGDAYIMFASVDNREAGKPEKLTLPQKICQVIGTWGIQAATAHFVLKNLAERDPVNIQFTTPRMRDEMSKRLSDAIDNSLTYDARESDLEDDKQMYFDYEEIKEEEN